MGTPLEQPNNGFLPRINNHHSSNHPTQVPSYFSLGENAQNGGYDHSELDEGDDILTDIDEPAFFGGPKLTKTYTVHFTPKFDDLLINIYHELQSIPTNTPFPGIVPPSGLLGKIASGTINAMINDFPVESDHKDQNPAIFDYQGIITKECLISHEWQPIFARLVRRRLLDLCNAHSSNSTVEYVSKHTNRKDSEMIIPTARTLSESTSIDVVTNANGNIVATHMPNSRHQSSISNLSLNELNVNSYKAAGMPPNSCPDLMNSRSRSSSLSLRKQSLTRNNSTASTSWLHVGNIHGVRPHSDSVGSQNLYNANNQFAGSTDSLQDFVSMNYVNRSATTSQPQNIDHASKVHKQQPPFAAMPHMTPPSAGPHQEVDTRYPDFHFYNPQHYETQHGLQPEMHEYHQPNPSARTALYPGDLINSDPSNIVSSSLSIDTNRMGPKPALDSPFMSAHPLASDLGYFANGFSQMTSSSNRNATNAPEAIDPISPGGQNRLGSAPKLGFTEKKRDSFNAKRGIL